MHSATMFYGYALYRAKSMWTRALMVLAMLAEGFSLIYFRFHDLPDLIGSLGFAAIEILCYHQLISKFGERRGEQYAITIAISISLFSMITMSILYRIPDHAWVAFYGLVGVAATMPLFTDRKLKTLRQKLLALLTISITSYLLHLVFGIINFQHYALSRIEFMLLPLVVFGSIGLYGEKG
ncbi:MAG: hypothetical protein LBB24_02815 [Rickettsiales bacterium]|nr:hypothetical protein [Rickettsiales bacterium]